ncbi:MAG: CoA transferase subunit A [Pseudomonadota bacterium]
MLDKSTTIEEIARRIDSGMTIGIGGWGGRRKPMAFVRALLNTDVRDLTVVAYGGPEVGMLAAAGKLKKLIFGFVSLDLVPLDAHFREVRQAGALEVMELDEGMLQLGLKAAAARLPFLPTRVGLASDVLACNPEIKTIRSPYDDGEELVAMPALNLDVTVCHVNEADPQGNSRISGPDPFFDEWLARAADATYLTAERIVETGAFNDPMVALQMPIERSLVSGVAPASLGAHPTSCGPDYGMDVDHMNTYNAAAKGGWPEYFERHVAGKRHEDYVAQVGGAEAIRALPLPVF